MVSSPLRVLVIDDEPLVCWSVSETLSACGDEVTAVHTAADALRAVTTGPSRPDVVLLDYKLPDADDFGLLETIRRVSPPTRVIVMSVYYTPEIAEEALAHGAAKVVSKPIDMRDVPALVHGGFDPTTH
jgi:CheY-like chemotaxis protein